MPFPAGLTLVTVHIQFDTPPDGGAFGAVRFTSPVPLLGASDDSIVPPLDLIARLASDGAAMIRLPACNDPQWSPTGWAYTVTASVNGNATVRGTMTLDYQTTTVELADVLVIGGTAVVPGVMYVTAAQLTAGLATKADVVHTHIISDVDDLQVQLDGKQAAGEYLVAADIDNLVSDETLAEGLALKANISSLASVATLGTYASLTAKPTIPATYSDLTGMVPQAALPAIAYTEFLGSVASQVAMLALVGQRGDWAFRSDLGTDWQLIAEPSSSLANWQERHYPASPVSSVFGRTGAVTGSKTDVGLANVDNTSDVGKPVSTAQAAAISAGDAAVAFTANLAYDQSVAAGTAVTSATGATNGAAATQLRGYLDISTAPTTGTWATGDVVATRIGYLRCTTGGTPGTWAILGRNDALDAAFAGWMGDPANIQAATIIPTAGKAFVFRFRALAATVSAMNFHITTPGSVLTNAFWTLHDDAGAIVSATAKSGDQSTNLQTGGERTMTLAAQQTVTPGAFYRARFWVTGTTLPTISRLCNSSSAAINAGGVLRWASASTGLTNLASAPDNLGSLVADVSTAWWAGWKA